MSLLFPRNWLACHGHAAEINWFGKCQDTPPRIRLPGTLCARHESISLFAFLKSIVCFVYLFGATFSALHFVPCCPVFWQQKMMLEHWQQGLNVRMSERVNWLRGNILHPLRDVLLDAGSMVLGAAHSQYTEESYNNATSFGRHCLTMQPKLPELTQWVFVNRLN